MEKKKEAEDNSADTVEDSIVEETVSNDADETEPNTADQTNGTGVKKDNGTPPEKDKYSMDENGTFKGDAMIANFKLTILLVLSMMDVGEIVQRLYKMVATLNGRETFFTMTAEEFSARAFMPAIYREVGPDAILYGSSKDLLIAVQESISEKVPHEEISLCTGFTPGYNKFLLPKMKITSAGIEETKDPVVDLSDGNLSRKVNFLALPDEEIKYLTEHLVNEFTALKSHAVMFPTIGHLTLSPFASWIVDELGRQKYTLHLKRPSGGGKTFIAGLVGSFFGNFGDQTTSWSSTGNSIEMEVRLDRV